MWPFASPGTKDKTVNYRKFDNDFAVAGQITPEQVQAVADAGFKSILCARPDGEEPGQPSFAEIAGAAERIGLSIVHIPVSGGLTEGALIRAEQAFRDLPKPVFGYCRSGARAGSLYSVIKRASVD
jgi:uncharacterized protein (TIGR01244 family)